MRTLTLLAGTSLVASGLLMASVHLLSPGTANATKSAAGAKTVAVSEERLVVSTTRAWVDPPPRSEAVAVKAQAVTADAVPHQQFNRVSGAPLPAASAPQFEIAGDVKGALSVGQVASAKKVSRRMLVRDVRYASLSVPTQNSPIAMIKTDTGTNVIYEQPIEFSLASR